MESCVIRQTCQFLILLFREFHILSEYYILRGGVVVVGAGSVVINTLVVGGKVEAVIKQIIYVHNLYNVQY